MNNIEIFDVSLKIVSAPNFSVWDFPLSNPTPAECPSIQHKSDTIHLEIASDSTGKDSVSQDCPPFQVPITSLDCSCASD